MNKGLIFNLVAINLVNDYQSSKSSLRQGQIDGLVKYFKRADLAEGFAKYPTLITGDWQDSETNEMGSYIDKIKEIKNTFVSYSPSGPTVIEVSDNVQETDKDQGPSKNYTYNHLFADSNFWQAFKIQNYGKCFIEGGAGDKVNEKLSYYNRQSKYCPTSFSMTY